MNRNNRNHGNRRNRRNRRLPSNNTNGIQINNENQNKAPKKFFCRIINDYYNKLFEKVLEVYGTHDYSETHNESLSLYERKIKFIDYVSDISNHNNDFKNITYNFLLNPQSIIKRDRLTSEIRGKLMDIFLKKP